MTLPASLTHTVLFGLALTLIIYALALELRTRWPFLHPLLVTSGILMLLLSVFHVPIPDYQLGGDLITFFLGPATVALAVPIYKHFPLIRKNAIPVLAALAAGSLTGILTAYACARAFHAARESLLSALSRSVTTPITMEIARTLHGSPALAAAITCLSGLTGAVLGPPLLRALGLGNALEAGLAMGTTAHGIGTATMLRTSETHGSYAALAMSLNGVLTACLLVPAAGWIERSL
jgi:predicted murein hydrolase (TIGR00659 family)